MMSEHQPHHEHLENLETPETFTHKHEKRAEHEHSSRKAEHAKHDVEAIHHKIDKEAKSAKETKVEKAPDKNPAEHYLVTKGLKQEAFKRSLQRARKHMSGSSRSFSKVIHQPVVDAISRVGEKTIARPTGILTGAIIALAGSTFLLWSAKHYGYQYNYLVVFLLLGAGYLLGLVIETIWYMIRKLRSAR